MAETTPRTKARPSDGISTHANNGHCRPIGTPPWRIQTQRSAGKYRLLHQQMLRRWDQAAGAADATHKPRSISRVGWGSQEVSCDPLSSDHAGGAPAP